jgi:hypothetical protein
MYRFLAVKTEGKRTVGKPRPSWEDDIKMGLREKGWDGVG